MAVMQLVEAGQVDLDDPVRDYVPELDLAGTDDDRITVRQVLQHRSGLPLNPAGGPILKGASEGTPLAAVSELEGKDLSSRPGTEMAYINANYVLAGLVVERASGMPYGTYVERNIFTPLGMSDSRADVDPEADAGIASGHRYVFGFTEETPPVLHEGTLAAGYLTSSARDLGRFLAVFLNDGVGLNGRRVLSDRGVRALLTPSRAETNLGPWADGVESRYAMGWFVGGPWDEPSILHPGDAADSSSLLVLLPERGIGVATVVNASNELPVPGNPAAIPRMERNAVDALIGEPIETGMSVRTFYLIFNLVLAILLGLATFALVRAVLDLKMKRSRAARRPVLAGIAALLWLLAALLFIFYPTLTGFGPDAMRAWHPDLLAAVWVIGALLAAVFACRIVWLVKTLTAGE
jgi:CubicO group peptidase (beta-lactamase class C family)